MNGTHILVSTFDPILLLAGFGYRRRNVMFSTSVAFGCFLWYSLAASSHQYHAYSHRVVGNPQSPYPRDTSKLLSVFSSVLLISHSFGDSSFTTSSFYFILAMALADKRHFKSDALVQLLLDHVETIRMLILMMLASSSGWIWRPVCTTRSARVGMQYLSSSFSQAYW